MVTFSGVTTSKLPSLQHVCISFLDRPGPWSDKQRITWPRWRRGDPLGGFRKSWKVTVCFPVSPSPCPEPTSAGWCSSTPCPLYSPGPRKVVAETHPGCGSPPWGGGMTFGSFLGMGLKFLRVSCIIHFWYKLPFHG